MRLALASDSEVGARDMAAKPDGRAEIACPLKGVIAAETCLEKQLSGCRCDLGLGALVRIQASAEEELRRLVERPGLHPHASSYAEHKRRIVKAETQLQSVDQIKGGLSEREAGLLAEITPESSPHLVLPPNYCQCGNSIHFRSTKCYACQLAEKKHSIRYCSTGCGRALFLNSTWTKCKICLPKDERDKQHRLRTDLPATKTELQVFRVIAQLIERDGKPPRNFEIGLALGQFRHDFASRCIAALRRKGYVAGRGDTLKILKPLPPEKHAGVA